MWIEKEWLREIIRVTKEWGFKYVENFCWIKKNVNNRIALQPGKLFNKSKLSLLIFRIGGDVDLRHQRSPDCVFDFVQPIEPGKRRNKKTKNTSTNLRSLFSVGEVSERKPDFLYQVIETMLPGAVYHPENNPEGNKLLEL